MLNRIGAVAASAILITVGTLALSGAALIRSESNLGARKVDYGQEHSLMSSLSDHSKLNVPAITDLSKPSVMFWFCPTNGCY